MKVKFNHWYNCLAAILLSMLGFSSCSTHKTVTEKNMTAPINGGIMLLYGTPTRDYRVIEQTPPEQQDAPAKDEKKEEQEHGQ